MAVDGAARPVQRFEFSTRDAAEAEEFIRQMYIGLRTRFGSGRRDARFSATRVEAGGMTASIINSAVDFAAVLDPFDHFFSFNSSRGRAHLKHGREETILMPGESFVYPLGIPMEIEEFDLSAQVLQLPMARLTAVAEEAAGIAAKDLRFEGTTPVSAAMTRQWRAFMDLAVGTLLAEDSPAAHPILAEELARTAAVTALHTFPNTALTVSYQPGPGWVAPRSVRLAAGFIEARADQPVTLDQIAAAAGVSGRALQYAFRRYYGTTPTGYLRRVRLERADAELLVADPASGLTVAEVAHRWGWASASQFTAAYQQRFGILPSHTLRS